MTRKSTTIDKARAVFLSALMVISVFGGSMALAGSAVAVNESNSSVSLGSDEVDATTAFTSKITTAEHDSAGNVDTIELSFESFDVSDYSKADLTVTHGGDDVSIDSVSSSSASELTITLANDIDLSESSSQTEDTVKVTTSVKNTVNPSNTGNYDASIALASDSSEVDSYTQKLDIVDSSTAPTVESFDASNPSSQDVKVSVTSDEQLDTVGVEISGAEDASLTTSDFTETKNDDGTYTYDATYVGSSDGKYTATLNTAADANGNDGAASEQATVTVDTTAPTFSDVSPSEGDTVRTDEPVFTVDITDEHSEVDPASIHVTVTDSEGTVIDQVGVSEPDDGITFDGTTLTIDPSDAPVRAYADGQVDVEVTAADTEGHSATLDSENDGKITFTVDTSQPSINIDGLVSASSPVNDDETAIDITATHGNSKIDASNITINVTDADGNLVYDANSSDSDAVDTSGYDSTDDTATDAFTLDPSADDTASTPAYPEGTVHVEVTAVTDHGETVTDTFFFEVDTTEPSVESITSSDELINYSDATEEQTLTIQYNEELSAAPTVSVNDTSLVSNLNSGDIQLSDVSLDSEDSSVVHVTVNYDETASSGSDVEFTVSGATDTANNDQSEDATKVVATDTKVPTLSTGMMDGTVLEGYVNFDEKFTVNDADGNTVSYAYQEDVDAWQNGEDATSIPSYFDTRNAEGKITLRASVTDDNGNTQTADVTLQLDNYDPSVTTVLEDGASLTGKVALSDLFTVEHASDTNYRYYDSTGWADVPDAALTDDGKLDTEALVSEDTDLDEDSSVDLRVVATDDNSNQDQGTITSVTLDNELDTSSVSVEQNADAEGTFTITVETDAPLSELDVTIDAVNDLASYEDYDDPSTRELTRGEFTETQLDSGNYEYTAKVAAEGDQFLRDGSYNVGVTSATDADGRTWNSEMPMTAGPGVIDTHRPLVDHAFIKSAQSGQTTIELQFSEPVDVSTLETGDIEFRGEAVDSFGDKDGSDGVIEVVINDNIQTGDAPHLTVVGNGSVEEVADDDGTTTLAGYDNSHAVGSVKLTLESGMNTVSVPAASGSISADVFFEKSDYVESIWTYDAESTTWENYNPDLDSDAPELEGGEGFIVKTNLPDGLTSTFSVQVNTLADDNPTEQDLEKGWNLVGHYQEGNQAPSNALESLNGGYNDVLTQDDDGNYVPITGDMQPGEGYWVYVTSDGVIYAENTDWQLTT